MKLQTDTDTDTDTYSGTDPSASSSAPLVPAPPAPPDDGDAFRRWFDAQAEMEAAETARREAMEAVPFFVAADPAPPPPPSEAAGGGGISAADLQDAAGGDAGASSSSSPSRVEDLPVLEGYTIDGAGRVVATLAGGSHPTIATGETIYTSPLALPYLQALTDGYPGDGNLVATESGSWYVLGTSSDGRGGLGGQPQLDEEEAKAEAEAGGAMEQRRRVVVTPVAGALKNATQAMVQAMERGGGAVEKLVVSRSDRGLGPKSFRYLVHVCP